MALWPFRRRAPGRHRRGDGVPSPGASTAGAVAGQPSRPTGRVVLGYAGGDEQEVDDAEERRAFLLLADAWIRPCPLPAPRGSSG